MSVIKVLHLASFDGNIGDNANHSGFYNRLKEWSTCSFEFEQLEIREFYWKKRAFDEDFVELVNRHDLLIIGGGNYFELWVEHSPTGTSIMIEPELFQKIRPPVFFNALGVDPAQGASEDCCRKFRRFLSLVLSDPKNFVSVRNDGSMRALKQYIGDDFARQVVWTPDAGALVGIDESFRVLPQESSYVAINIAGDMLDTRFPKRGGFDDEAFVTSFAEVVALLLSKEAIDEVLFIPHIYKDLCIINRVLSCIPDSVVRKKISVGPLLHGQGAESKLFALYKHALFSLSMRFHANLCAIGLGVPTIGLANYRQIEMLFEELGIEENVVHVNSLGFEKQLVDKVDRLLQHEDEQRQLFRNKSAELGAKYDSYMSDVCVWLGKNNLSGWR